MKFLTALIFRLKTWISIQIWKRRLIIPQEGFKGSVLISAFRNETWIEWAIYSAFVISQKGYGVTIIYKHSEITRLYSSNFLNFWKVARSISIFKFIDIESLPYNKNDYERYYHSNLTNSVASLAYDFKVESADIIDENNAHADALEEFRIIAAENASRIFLHLNNNIYHQFILYSGLIYDTPGILEASQDGLQDVVCVEGWGWRAGHMIYNFNAPALEYNLKGWFKFFKKLDEQKENELNQYFSFLDGEKIDNDWLNNFVKVQPKEIEDHNLSRVKNFVQEDKAFLLATNVIGDSSLLNRETIFASHKGFIKETIDFFKSRPNLKLIIRIHPGEAIIKSRVKVRLGELVKAYSNGVSNILVIHSNEKINSFLLIPYIRCGIVWISSIGVDLVARGIPVIATANPKYSGLGIVDEPTTKDEYFQLVQNYSSREFKPSSEQVSQAKMYLYVVFKGFSFEAQGRTFRADSMHLNKMPNQEEHDRFYRIILKEESAPDQDLANS